MMSGGRVSSSPRTVGRATSLESGAALLEDRRFAQTRLAFFARLMFLLTLGGFVMANVVTYGGWPGGGQLLRSDANLSHLGAAVTFLFVWLVARGSTLNGSALLGLDLLGIVAATALLDAMAAHLPIELRPDLESRHLVMLLVTTNVLIARAVLVPSHPHFTMAVGLAASVPAIVTAVTMDGPGTPKQRVAYSLTWLFFALVTSTIVSQVIYGLRETVREASKLGRYTLVEKLGQGGMGTVYRAKHAMLRRPTAVKLLDAKEVGDVGLKRFEKEVHVTARLTHPSTIQIFDYGRTRDGIFYYAMELIDGLNLRELVERHGAQPPARVASLTRQICGSLAEAHGHALVHRDVKPENLILTCRPGQGDVLKVVDFGLVKDDERGRNLSKSGTVLGTPHYLSPEAIETPDTVGPKSDIYALGGVMYYLLTGEHVFDRTSITELCCAHIAEDPVPPSLRSGLEVPEALEELVMACLAKNPAHRPKSAEAIAASLDDAELAKWGTEDAARWWRRHAR